jgi:hypothetical protein
MAYSVCRHDYGVGEFHVRMTITIDAPQARCAGQMPVGLGKLGFVVLPRTAGAMMHLQACWPMVQHAVPSPTPTRMTGTVAPYSPLALPSNS